MFELAYKLFALLYYVLCVFEKLYRYWNKQ